MIMAPSLTDRTDELFALDSIREISTDILELLSTTSSSSLLLEKLNLENDFQRKLRPTERSLIDQQREIERLSIQLNLYHALIPLLSKESISEYGERNPSSLEKTRSAIRQIIVEAAYSAPSHLNAIFKGISSSGPEVNLSQLLKCRDKLLISLAEVSNQLYERNKEIIKISRGINDKLLPNRALVKQISSLRENRDELDKNYEVRDYRYEAQDIMKHKLFEARRRLNIVQNLVRNMVLESNIDWSNNQELRDVILQCSN